MLASTIIQIIMSDTHTFIHSYCNNIIIVVIDNRFELMRERREKSWSHNVKQLLKGWFFKKRKIEKEKNKGKDRKCTSEQATVWLGVMVLYGMCVSWASKESFYLSSTYFSSSFFLSFLFLCSSLSYNHIQTTPWNFPNYPQNLTLFSIYPLQALSFNLQLAKRIPIIMTV